MKIDLTWDSLRGRHAPSRAFALALLAASCSAPADVNEEVEPPGAPGSLGEALSLPANNIVTNPSFEANANSWSSWQGTIQRAQTADAPDGAYSVRVRYGGAGGMYSLAYNPVIASSIVAGTTYTATASLRTGTGAATGRPATLILREKNSAGQQVKLWSSASKALTRTFATLTVTAKPSAGNQLDLYVLQDQAVAGDIFMADAISVVSAAPPPPSDGFGLLGNGLRDKLLWPFASNSIWNTPIGGSAAYQSAGITANNGGGYPTFFYQDHDVIVMTPTAPNLNVYKNNVGWSGGDRCPAQSAQPITTVPVPTSYVLPNSGENNSAAFLMADGRTVRQNQPFTRCSAGGSATTFAVFPENDIYGQGNGGAHGGSSLSALGGTIRLGEFRSGRIHHAMKVYMWAAQYYKCCSPIWPATSVDGYANGTTYGGTNPKLGPGALLALLPGFNVAALSTVPGRILAQAFKDYGAYAVDDTYSNGWAVAIEQGPSGRVYDEFTSLYGFPMRPNNTDPLMNDIRAIFSALQIVTNNGPSSIGGGGTPRVAVAPAIGN